MEKPVLSKENLGLVRFEIGDIPKITDITMLKNAPWDTTSMFFSGRDKRSLTATVARTCKIVTYFRH